MQPHYCLVVMRLREFVQQVIQLIIFRFIYPVLTNIWFNASAFGEQELNCFQESLYTGMMEYSKANSLTNSLRALEIAIIDIC